jgi:hypothetical protein
MSLNRDEKFVAERQRREDERIAAEAKRRSANGKPGVTREQVDVLLAAMSPQGRAEVIHMASSKLGRRSLPWMTR